MIQLIFGSDEAKVLLHQDSLEQETRETKAQIEELEHVVPQSFDTAVELSDWLFDHSKAEPEDVFKLIRQLASNYTGEYYGDDDEIGKIGNAIMAATKGYN